MADIEYLEKTEDTNIPENDPRRSFSASDANEVKAAVNSKVDKVSGKTLSTNDYTNTDKEKVTNLPSDTNAALGGKVDKVTGKGLSTEDYTTADKNKVANVPANTVSELANKVDVVPGRQLSQENFTSAEKSKLASLSVTYVGTYTSLAALQAAYPTGQAGYEAIIDGGVSQDPQKAFWDSSDNQWVIQTGGGASSFSELAGSPSDNAALQAAFDTKSNVGHTHSISDVSGLGGALDAKSDVGHGHSIAQVSGLSSALAGKSDVGHGHAISDVSGLSSALAAKADDNAVVKTTGNQSNIAGEKEFTGGISFHELAASDITGNTTLTTAQRNRLVRVTAAAQITIPANVFAANNRITLIRRGVGEVEFLAGAGLTLNSASSRRRIAEQFNAVQIIFDSATEATIYGALKV